MTGMMDLNEFERAEKAGIIICDREPFAVYHMIRDNEVFYVGYTNQAERRLNEHKERFGSDISMKVVIKYQML